MPLMSVEFTKGSHQSGNIDTGYIYGKPGLEQDGDVLPVFIFHSWILMGSEVSQCYEIQSFFRWFAYGVALKLGGHRAKITSSAVPLCGTEVNTDAFRERWLLVDAAHPTWLPNLQILSQQLGSLGLRLLLLQEKDRKKKKGYNAGHSSRAPFKEILQSFCCPAN